MSKRGDAELVEDIAEAIARIERYTPARPTKHFSRTLSGKTPS
jgi:hypothetical protein